MTGSWWLSADAFGEQEERGRRAHTTNRLARAMHFTRLAQRSIQAASANALAALFSNLGLSHRVRAAGASSIRRISAMRRRHPAKLCCVLHVRACPAHGATGPQSYKAAGLQGLTYRIKRSSWVSHHPGLARTSRQTTAGGGIGPVDQTRAPPRRPKQ